MIPHSHRTSPGRPLGGAHCGLSPQEREEGPSLPHSGSTGLSLGRPVRFQGPGVLGVPSCSCAPRRVSLRSSPFSFSKLRAGHSPGRTSGPQETLSSCGAWGPVTHPLCCGKYRAPLQAPQGPPRSSVSSGVSQQARDTSQCMNDTEQLKFELTGVKDAGSLCRDGDSDNRPRTGTSTVRSILKTN